MYEVEQDKFYCYSGTTVLKNKLDLRDAAELADFEAEITAQRASEPLPEGGLDYTHYKAVHRHLFQDVYPWAGEIRKVRIGKDGNWFCFPDHIDKQMFRLAREGRLSTRSGRLRIREGGGAFPGKA